MRVRFDFQLGGGGRNRRAAPRKKAALIPALHGISGEARGWWPTIRESFTGAWQHNVTVEFDSVLAYHAVFSCTSLIANDFGKLATLLYEWDESDKIWIETESAAFSPVLRKPNKYQTFVQYKEFYMMSKLLRGNVYCLKQRDARGIVVAMYVLDPTRVKPLVTPDGSVYYQLGADNLTNGEIDVEKVVPASEIIHDRINCIYHPLVGESPIFACGLAAMQGLAIQKNSTRFFGSMSRPSGILTAPGHIKKATAERLKEHWQSNYGGENYGKVAVLGDDLKYQPISVSAEDAQLIEQFQLTAKIICSCFHVPPFKIGLEPVPAGNAELANQIYLDDCLSSHIEQYEAVTDDALGIGRGNKTDSGKIFGVGLDLDGLHKMDDKTQTEVLSQQVLGALRSPDEARQKLDLPKVPGGEFPYLQQQNYNLAALEKRDSQPDPFGKPPAPAPLALPPPDSEPPDDANTDEPAGERALAALRRELAA